LIPWVVVDFLTEISAAAGSRVKEEGFSPPRYACISLTWRYRKDRKDRAMMFVLFSFSPGERRDIDKKQPANRIFDLPSKAA
jgi:hypothetical protein